MGMLAPSSQDLDEHSDQSEALTSSQVSGVPSDCVKQENAVHAALASTMLPDDDLEDFQDAESVAENEPSLNGVDDVGPSSDEEGDSYSVQMRPQYCKLCGDAENAHLSGVDLEPVLSGDDGYSSLPALELDEW